MAEVQAVKPFNVLCRLHCLFVLPSLHAYGTVCPAHGGKGPNCDQCPGEMVVIEDGTCKCWLSADACLG